MHPGKIVLIVTWAYAIGSFVIAPESAVAGIGRLLFWGMGAIHVIECAIFLHAIRRAEGSTGSHLARVLAFGFLHLQEIGALGRPGSPKS